MMKNNENKKRHAFTVVEVMVATICMTIVLGPIIMLLRSGSKSSLMGMMRIDTTLEARRVLQQIYADLKMACLILPEKEAASEEEGSSNESDITDNFGINFAFEDIQLKNPGNFPNLSYEFYSFPLHKEYKDIFKKESNKDKNIAYRYPSKITYRVEGETAPYKLIREESFKNEKKRTKVLTDNLNYFEITEFTIPKDNSVQIKQQNYYYITLQLIDVLHSSDLKDKDYLGKRLEKDPNLKDVVTADFFDVVYPEYYNALYNDKRLNPNWHVKLSNNKD